MVVLHAWPHTWPLYQVWSPLSLGPWTGMGVLSLRCCYPVSFTDEDTENQRKLRNNAPSIPTSDAILFFHMSSRDALLPYRAFSQKAAQRRWDTSTQRLSVTQCPKLPEFWDDTEAMQSLLKWILGGILSTA